MRCQSCEWNYPELILNSMNVNGEYIQLLCGICALDITNKVHDTKRTKFKTPVAESLRISALEWRKKHSDDAPL